MNTAAEIFLEYMGDLVEIDVEKNAVNVMMRMPVVFRARQV
jgi:hypothetical protein